MWNPFKTKKETTESLAVYEETNPKSTQAELVPEQSESTYTPYVTNSDFPNAMESKLKVAEMAKGLASQAMDVYQTSFQVEQNITAIRAASDVQLANITHKFEFCKSALEHVFQDRHSALAAHYCVLGDAMK